ncbi:MAG: hypothetical protein EOL87_01605 [Spartobacteria bacterium]|nr:hypothetical protein [Spartobacteria bacterium]
MRFFLLVMLIGLLGLCGFLMYMNFQAPNPEPGTDASLISAASLQDLAPEMAHMGRYVSVGVICFAFVMQLFTWLSAFIKLCQLRRKDEPAELKLQMLESIEVYFDLPLYFGLFGTVVSFILITVFPDVGLIFAYLSTALGIIVSVLMRLMHFTPYQQRLLVEVSQYPTRSNTPSVIYSDK